MKSFNDMEKRKKHNNEMKRKRRRDNIFIMYLELIRIVEISELPNSLSSSGFLM
jgi:hypothetical protein